MHQYICVYLDNNKYLTEIKGFELIKFSELVELHLEKNALVELPFIKTNFDKLQLLTLTHNRLETIDLLK